MKKSEISPHIFTISEVLSGPECESLIALAEAATFEAAPINAAGGPRLHSETRNNDRVIRDDAALSRQLWARVEEFIPPKRAGRSALGLNERFRFYRYKVGQKFDWHADAPFARSSGEISLLTFMVYLNSGYGGGTTRFESLSVEGQAGMALIFEHGLIHTGTEVTHGVKYALRTDVMYG